MRSVTLQFVSILFGGVLALPAFAQSIIAHRGASYDAPENTLAAFHLAWKQGADGIEGDFYLSSDGRIVCIHDKDTERVAGTKLIVSKTPFAKLRALDVGAWKGEKWRGEKIPTLKEVIETIPEDKQFFIELKTGPEIVEPLAKELESSPLQTEQIVLISFNEKTIAACKKRLPHLKTLWVTGFKNEQEDGSGLWSPGIEEVIQTTRQSQADGLDAQSEMRHFDARFISQLEASGITEFGVWTVDDPKIARFYQKLGASAITTNRPNWIRQHLRLTEKNE
ncbi:MAG: glycerophosphodiester phosphodiesterase [Pirellulales bacterium]|nr:glycerophosphodiester phosphodiesterase [Pirellulales bacterium]